MSHRAAFHPRILNTGTRLLCLVILLSAFAGCQPAPDPIHVHLSNLDAVFDLSSVSITSPTGLSSHWQISAGRDEDALTLNSVAPIQSSSDLVVYQRGAWREEYHISISNAWKPTTPRRLLLI